MLALLTMLTLTFNAYSDQGKLEATLKENAAIIERTNKELTKEKATSIKLVATIKNRDINYAKQTKEINKLRHETAVMEKELGSIISGGDIISINNRLCQTFDRIEGNDISSREARCNSVVATSTPSSVYYKIDEKSLYNNLANWQRVASVIDQCFFLNKEEP